MWSHPSLRLYCKTQGFLFVFKKSFYIRSNPGFVVWETPHSLDGDDIIHTEMNVVLYAVCKAINVLPIRLLEFTPHSSVKTVFQSLLRPIFFSACDHWLSVD